jgi:demethylmenaquinone methyltransferase/2-methoxy-6-polyprenyl-1,4-benzoquinol methylase
MSRISHLDQTNHLNARDPKQRQHYVTEMFEEIAPRYDAFTRLFSFGMDAGWKKELVKAVVRNAPGLSNRARDLACGTGDLAVAVAEAMPGINVEGIDVASEMIARARPFPRVRYRVGDASALPDVNGSVDIVTVGYGLRNFPDHRAALADIARALRSGGVLAILEFTRPSFAPWRWIFLSYLWLAGMVVGWLWHRHGPVYGYIAHSIARFTTRRELIATCATLGLKPVHDSSKLGGGMCVLVLKKA